MIIALPVAEERLCQHFGHADHFFMFEVDEQNVVRAVWSLNPPPHEPGVLPRWLHEQGADTVIAGGMGSRAQRLFEENGIKVVVGAPAGDPGQAVQDYLDGALATGSNTCDH